MIYLQIVFGWSVIVFLILCMLYCLLMFCDETETLSQYIPWLKFPWRFSTGGRCLGCLVSIPFFAIFAIFFIAIMFIYETFIHNKLPQKPQGVSVKQENAKSSTPKKLSQEEQIVQKTLQKQ